MSIRTTIGFPGAIATRLVVVASALLFAGCSGGGGDEGGGGPGGTFDDPPSLTGAPFVGRMVGAQIFDNTIRGVDLRTGRFQELPGSNNLLSLEVLNDNASVQTVRDRSVSSGMLLTIDDCVPSVSDTTCFMFLDRDGNLTSRFLKRTQFPGAAKVSFGGTHVAVDLSDRVGGNSTMTIYTRDGDFVSNFAQSGTMADEAYDWLPDGRLVYSMEGNQLLGDSQPTGFIISEPFSATPARRITLPDFYQEGRIISMESSPDGGQVLINVEPRVGPARPILIDTETLAVTQLVDRTQATATDVKRVVFGPDGRWVYAVISTSQLLSGPSLDSSLGGTVVFIGSSDTLFAFEVNGTTHSMPQTGEVLSSSVFVVPTDNPGRPGGEIGGGQYDGELVWIP